MSLPRANEQWLAGFASGLFELANEYNVALVGGDTVRGPLVITVQIAGWVEADAWLTRSGAKPGDLLFVSGIPGEAAAGLAVIQRRIIGGESAAFLKHRFLRPRPRIELGRQLRNVATAAMDVSDGLLTDLKKLCAASGCGAQLNVDALPESAAMRELFEADDGLQYALAGGDDYELLVHIAAERGAGTAEQTATAAARDADRRHHRATVGGAMPARWPAVQDQARRLRSFRRRRPAERPGCKS